MRLKQLSNQLKSSILSLIILELSLLLSPMVLYHLMLVEEVMLETSSEELSVSWKRMIGGASLEWRVSWKSLNFTRQILKEFMVNSQNTKVSLKSFKSNLIDGNTLMTNLSKSLKKLSNKEKVNSQLMTGLHQCKHSVSQPIRLLRLSRSQFHKVCIMKLLLDKKRQLKKRKPFYITLIIYKRLIKLFTRIIVSWIMMPKSLKFSRMWNKIMFQTSLFLTNQLFTQLPEDNNTIPESLLLKELRALSTLLMPSK
mgnify:CR=1 FL=1